MADTRTPEQRQRIMRAVRQRHTAPELELRRALYAVGVRGWRCHWGSAYGQPDLAWPSLRLAVFVDGAFWHGHPSRHTPGRSGAYWDTKIARNVERDRRVDAKLAQDDWLVVRVWDFEVRRDLPGVVRRIEDALATQISTSSGPVRGWRGELADRAAKLPRSTAGELNTDRALGDEMRTERTS
jgi:DNA mismatch endonuclease, patch repair protein